MGTWLVVLVAVLVFALVFFALLRGGHVRALVKVPGVMFALDADAQPDERVTRREEETRLRE